jgi:hypothetical protein
MRKLLLLLITFNCLGQVETDSIAVKKVTSSWYGRSMFISLLSPTQTGEMLRDRLNANVEIGKSFGVVDVGLCVGKTYENNWKELTYNTTDITYFEGRINMDACQYGIFSNEISLGVGYATSKSAPIMLEISSTIFAQIGDNWGLGLVYGTYNFTGDTNDINKNFTGLFLRYGLIRDDGGILLSRSRIRTNHSKHQTHPKHNNS